MKRLLFSLLSLTTLFSAEYVVDQKNKTFLPGELSVHVGDIITFKNSDPFSHNAYTDEEENEFDVGMQKSGTKKSVKVKGAHDFNIECAIHPNMLIKVKVDK